MQEPAGAPARRALYTRLLRLRHVAPNGWQRALLVEGALSVAVLLVLADLASAWSLLVLPVAVALLVKGHDLLAGLLAGGRRPDPAASGPAGSRPAASGAGGTGARPPT